MNTTNQNKQDKLVFKIVTILSIVVLVAVVILNRKILPRPEIMPNWVMYLPKLNALQKITDIIKHDLPGDKFMAWCEVDGTALINQKVNKLTSNQITILIGPEGDFSPEEVALAEACGYSSVSLGDYRLRTETAALLAVFHASIAQEI
jgi:RsmE family RNA methyltransferase